MEAGSFVAADSAAFCASISFSSKVSCSCAPSWAPLDHGVEGGGDKRLVEPLRARWIEMEEWRGVVLECQRRRESPGCGTRHDRTEQQVDKDRTGQD